MNAASESKEAIQEALYGFDMLFVRVCLLSYITFMSYIILCVFLKFTG